MARLEGVESISREADGTSDTAQLNPRAGKLLPPEIIARQLEAIRIGARLRGVEATVDGWLKYNEGNWLLQVPGTDQLLQLQPLTKKVHWNPRTESPAIAAPSELAAFAALIGGKPKPGTFARIVGPLLGSAPAILEVRDFHLFSRAAPKIASLDLVIVVNSPYGLIEPWVSLRQALARLTDAEWVADQPNIDTSTVTFRTRNRSIPDLEDWARNIQASGEGAHLSGIEVTVHGSILAHGTQLSLHGESGSAISLAPLTRNVLWDFRKHSEIPATLLEQTSWKRLHAEASRISGLQVAVTGPFIRSSDRQQALIEVRRFQLLQTDATLTAATTASVEPPPILFARSVGREVQLDWPAVAEGESIRGYYLYASETLDPAAWKRVHATILTKPKHRISIHETTPQTYYCVTTVDSSGIESARSHPASPMPPSPPVNLTVQVENGRAQLNWADNSEPDFDSYSVFRSQTPTGPFQEIASVVLDSRYIDTGVKPGNPYYYKILAADHSGNQSEL